MSDDIKTKALFLDRDGIINTDHGYVYKIDDFEFVEGIFDLVKLFSDAGYLIFVVTNQSGIGRGYYTVEDFHTLTAWMTEKFYAQGIAIEEVCYCPHTPDDQCTCRKPATGMIAQALKHCDIDLSQSWMIGDKCSDIELAGNSGIGRSIFIGNDETVNADYTFNSIKACLNKIPELLH